MVERETVRIKPYMPCELALHYEISRKTLSKWLKVHKEKIGKRHGHYYSVAQVKIIFNILGEPYVEEKSKR